MAYASLLSSHTLGDMMVDYIQAKESQAVGLRIYPAALSGKAVDPASQAYQDPARRVDPLVQMKIQGDPIDGFAQGLTMRNSATLSGLVLEAQEVLSQGTQAIIITRLKSERGYACEHRLGWREGDPFLSFQTVFHNESSQPLTLEMLSSFSLDGVSPFAQGIAPGRLFIHRFRSFWSMEGRHEVRPVEEMNLEPSWSNYGVRAKRYGQVGSMPVRGFFPWAGIEDREEGVLWGAELAVPGSWQMEFYRRGDFLCLSGGLADREFGHWTKTVQPGDSFETPLAFVSTVQGSLDDLCARLVSAQERVVDSLPPSETDLPVICNEWCTSWGNPNHEDLLKMADRLQGSGVKYLVIDAGWYKGDQGSWGIGQGDWTPNPKLFPYGLKGTAQAIRERGLIPGIWFEMEVVGQDSSRFHLDQKHFLKRDGLPITAAGRHFWDFRDPWVHSYLGERVIGQLKESGLGYIKVDYNETIGIGADAAASSGDVTSSREVTSLGEGLRQHLEGVQDFFRKMRAEIPDLVIENCSSGGHRLEPSMLALVSMASFSDAHESPEIPIIAAALQRLILPRQSQIWAVLHRSDTLQRLAYSLAAGFLGRLCLSGEITTLDEPQWDLVKESIQFYQKVSHVIAEGKSQLVTAVGPSWRNLQGAQAALRVAANQHSALIVTHSFSQPLPQELAVPLPGEGWQVEDCFPKGTHLPEIEGHLVRIKPLIEWSGAAFYVKKMTPG